MTQASVPDTEELLNPTANGDAVAVDSLFTRNRPRLRKMVAVWMDPRLSKRVDPSDVIQDTLTDAFVQLPKYLRERPLPFYPWLRQFAWNRLVDMHRRHLLAGRRSVLREDPRNIGIPDESMERLVHRFGSDANKPDRRIIWEEMRDREWRTAQRLSVTLALDRGLMHFEEGQIAHGLLWLSRALELTSEEDGHLERVARANLRDWSRQVTTLERMIAPSLPAAADVVAFAPSGDLLAMADGPRVHLREIDSGAGAMDSIEHATDVTTLTFGHAGKRLYLGDRKGGVFCRDLHKDDSRPLGLEHRQPIVHLDCSPDGQSLLTTEYRAAIRVWNLADSSLLGEVPIPATVRAFGGRFSGDGQRVVTWTGGLIQQWSLPEWSLQNQFSSDGRQAQDVVFTPDRTQLLVNRLSQAVLYDTYTAGVEGEPLQHPGEIMTLAIDPQGEFFLTGSQDRTARLWDAGTHQPIGQPLEHEDTLLAVAFRPDSLTFLTACNRGVAKLWQRPPGPVALARLPHPEIPLEVLFARNGERVVTLSGERWHRQQTLRLWEVSSGRLLEKRSTGGLSVKAMAIGADGQRLALTGGGKLALGRIGNGLMHEKTVDCSIGTARAVTFSPQGDQLAVAGSEGIRFYEVPSLTERRPALTPAGPQPRRRSFSSPPPRRATTT